MIVHTLSRLTLLALALNFVLGPNVTTLAAHEELGCHCISRPAQDASTSARKRPHCHAAPADEAIAESTTRKEACRCRSYASIAGSTCSCRHHGAEGITVAERSLIRPIVTVERGGTAMLQLRAQELPASLVSVPDTPPPRSSSGLS